MQNINDYNEKSFCQDFKTSDLYHTISQDFDNIVFDKHFPNVYDRSLKEITPREKYALTQPTYFSAVPFYYFQYLDHATASPIYDLGCGANLFKKYIPNIVGIGAEDPTGNFFHGDQHGIVDESFYSSHQNFFDRVFSINALHFCALSNLTNVIRKFASMIKPEGKGFLALNVARLIEHDSRFGQIHTRDGFRTGDSIDLDSVEHEVRTMIGATDLSYEVIDVDFSYYDNWMDGNIRLVVHGK